MNWILKHGCTWLQLCCLIGKETTMTSSTRLWLIITSHLISSMRTTPYLFAPRIFSFWGNGKKVFYFCDKWKQLQKNTTGPNIEANRLWKYNPKEDIYIIALAFTARGSVWKRGKKDSKRENNKKPGVKQNL